MHLRTVKAEPILRIAGCPDEHVSQEDFFVDELVCPTL